MAIIGFGFTKMSAQKKAGARGKVSINNNVSFTRVEETTFPMAPSKKALRVHFSFHSRFDPDIGTIELEGEVLVLEEPKTADEMVAKWNKEKSIPAGMIAGLLNHILDRCNVEALILSRDMNLPSPIPLPKANVVPKEQAVAKKETKKK